MVWPGLIRSFGPVRISVRLDPQLHDRLHKRAAAAQVPFSAFIRSVLEQAADPNGRYIYSSQDEILATTIQILSILATSVGDRAPDTLKRGMAEARALLRDRGLLDPDLPR
ncbi:CopG family transcriptional regulator [Sphingomonas sp. BIUV-7]|uniref:CopG family transcriptional regulator n=1 Tax=Sphingomonas natans TaxID=3063330 RepID=A0ABT8YAH6_9SPHN|nr:ribbon-helix-helix protein, CopG family [Sphingomonas sp. BIUV-7]MDO6415343.1 CopG family transcriptional regulator [Sphingomonas sp. BIUV-7]